MKKALLPLLLTLSLPAFALDCSYQTYIHEDDLYNSSGKKLTNIGQVLRQDRANTHDFGISDDKDYCGYDKPAQRAKLERIINASTIKSTTKRRIMGGNVNVEVNINKGRAMVFILD